MKKLLLALLFSPSLFATGVEGPGATGGTSNSSEVISLWTGTCNSGTFLRADGACAAPGGGVAQTTGTFQLTWPTACTTTPSQTWLYTKTGNMVTLRMVDAVSCTSDSTSFSTAIGELPTTLRPTTDTIIWGVPTVDNAIGDVSLGCLIIQVDGQVIAARTAGVPHCGNTWLNASTKGLSKAAGYPMTFVYTLD